MKEELYAEAILGKDAEEFLSSELGRYLLARMEEEEKDAMTELTKVWSWNRRKIQRLQNQVYRVQTLKSWFAELIVSGRQALHTLDTDE